MDNFSQPVRVHFQHSSDCEEGAGEMEPPPGPLHILAHLE